MRYALPGNVKNSGGKKKSWIRPFILIHTKSLRGLFWAKAHPPPRLSESPILTNQPSNKQTNMGENLASLAI